MTIANHKCLSFVSFLVLVSIEKTYLSRFVRNTPLRVVFWTGFSMFGNVMKHCLSFDIFQDYCWYYSPKKQVLQGRSGCLSTLYLSYTVCSVSKWLEVLWRCSFTQRKTVRLITKYGLVLNTCNHRDAIESLQQWPFLFTYKSY